MRFVRNHATDVQQHEQQFSEINMTVRPALGRYINPRTTWGWDGCGAGHPLPTSGEAVESGEVVISIFKTFCH